MQATLANSAAGMYVMNITIRNLGYVLHVKLVNGNLMAKKEMIVLVDKNDKKIGLEEKLKAHEGKGKLHRAISIFVFNKKGELMVQRRAFSKYHSKGQWANTCCTHPHDKETILHAGHRRLKYEMGFDCKLQEVLSFIYHADVGENLRENEYDHVLFGFYEKSAKPNPEEVSDWKFVDTKKLVTDMEKNPNKYAPWFRIIIKRALKRYDYLKKHKNLNIQ